MATPGTPPAADPGPSEADPGPARRPRSPLRLALAAALVLTGAVWIGQGLGILTAGRSFMIGDSLWALIGAAFVVVGLVVAIRARRAA